jgi:hypothetical protein
VVILAVEQAIFSKFPIEDGVLKAFTGKQFPSIDLEGSSSTPSGDYTKKLSQDQVADYHIQQCMKLLPSGNITRRSSQFKKLFEYIRTRGSAELPQQLLPFFFIQRNKSLK